MRSTKQERKRNARVFYQSLMSGVYDRAAIVAVRNESSNPNIQRCQFFAVIGLGMSKPVVIAESVWGVEGCFMELLNHINDTEQVHFHDDKFGSWLENTFKLKIDYWDGFVFVIKKCQ
ncbi:hypothetical protein [Anaerotignum lactatifermentans]|uniref:hypothetical protein n=1 Tax=Anaerotignum lactatifermentans TaxID=160404 RepID=UPI00174A57F2|nr:hypothetical protein [Anaerotignum lactatifermentans]